MANTYILVHRYADKSAFHICGATTVRDVATAWYEATDETDVFEVQLNGTISNYSEGVEGWRQQMWDNDNKKDKK